MDDIESLKEQLDAAKGEDKEKLQKEWHEQLVSTAARLRRVLDAADARTDRRELNQARYFLAFVDYELGYNDEAAILADYAARRLHIINPELSREAARLALAAYEQEYEARSPAQRPVMVRIARPVAEFLIRNWPEQDRANEARITMARLCDRAKLYVEAAEWYANVTDGSELYAEAQIGAGREYWVASQSVPKRSTTARTGAPGTADPQISELTAKAEKFLKNGIEKAGDAADANGNPPGWLTVGKTELANLDIGLGRYDDAVKLLTDPPHSVVVSVAVTDEATRPSEGVKGRPFASYVFQSLLRAQIGRHQVDSKLEAMQQLETIAGASGAEGVTAIYVSLGKEIEKELARLIATNDRARLGEVRKSFERFLEELSKRSEKMSYGSLLWIAETYTGLGDGLAEDPTAAREYFAKAAHAYEQLLTRAAADNSPSRTDRMLSLQLRLSNCLRRQGNYAKSLEILREVIGQRPKALDVQVAAANLLQDWGASPDAGSELRSLDAIRGLRDQAVGGAVWGWEGIAARLERVLASGKADNELREKYFEARYNIPFCRHQFAERAKDAAARTKALEVALGEINAFALVSTDLSDESWRKLDTLYQDIETDLGRKPAPLARPDLRTATAATAGSSPATPQKPTASTKAKTAEVDAIRSPQNAPVAKTDKPISTGIAPGWILIGLFFVITATIAGVVWNIRRQKPTRASITSLGAPEFVDLPGQSAARPKPTVPKPQPKAGSTLTRKPSGPVSEKTVPQKKAGPKAP
jgi:tetratricopeptide (TPR) repeat protein